MQPPDALIQRGISSLPTLGDGRLSGTSDSPSILNASPEAAVGGSLAYLQDGDLIRVDLNAGTCNVLIDDAEFARRKSALDLTAKQARIPASQTPWQVIYRQTVGQMETGTCMELAVGFRSVGQAVPRHNH